MSTPLTTDDDRRSFLDDLDQDPKINVTDWEAQFISSTLVTETFTPKQRNIIDRMMAKYNPRIF